MSSKTFLLIKLILFAIFTFISLSVILYFPNVPTVLRPLVRELQLGSTKTFNPDDRFLKWFNRDPERNIPQDKYVVVSPADGVVEHILHRSNRLHIVIEMRYTDVHVQRVPLSGKLLSIHGGGVELREGFNLMDYELDKMLPYQKVTTFETNIGLIKVRQITSFFAKRIQVFLKVGEYYQTGKRLGNVLAGSTVVLELPSHVKVLVRKHQEVLAGETIIATYSEDYHATKTPHRLAMAEMDFMDDGHL